MIAGVYHWFPKMYGRMMNNTLGYIHFWITFAGVYFVFFPMHYIGIAGFPRRYYQWSGFDAFNSYADLNAVITIAAILTFMAQGIFIYNFVYSIFKGKKQQKTLGNQIHSSGLLLLNQFTATGLENCLPFIGGHMIIQNQVLLMTLFLKMFLFRQHMNQIFLKRQN